MPDITLTLNDASRDKALRMLLLCCRMNQRFLMDIYQNLLSVKDSEMNEIFEQYKLQELAWIYRVLGAEGGLDVPDLDQFLNPKGPKS